MRKVTLRRLAPEIAVLLDDVPHEFTRGSRHYHLRIRGVLVLVLPIRPHELNRASLNALAHVRRHLRQQGEKQCSQDTATSAEGPPMSARPTL